MNHSEPTPLIRRARARRGAKGRESFATARVTVSWSANNHDGMPPLTPTEFELMRKPSADRNQLWNCSDDFEIDWLQALYSARCHEVVLTARLGDDIGAKHLVLELAEQLRFKLEHQPLIRVLFLPSTSAPRAFRNHA